MDGEWAFTMADHGSVIIAGRKDDYTSEFI